MGEQVENYNNDVRAGIVPPADYSIQQQVDNTRVYNYKISEDNEKLDM